MAKKELGKREKIDLGDDYVIEVDSNEDAFFDDADQDREYFEDAGEDVGEGAGDEGFDDYEFVDEDEFEEGEGAGDEGSGEDNQTLFEDTTKTDMQTFILWWKTFDESRAVFFGAKFGQDPKTLLFYPDIEDPDANTTIKKAGAIVVKKYSDLIFFSHAPEMILLASVLISTGVVFFRAKGRTTKEKEPEFKEGSNTSDKMKQNFEFVKTS